MSFHFNWPEFDNTFYNEIKSHLEAGLNKGNNSKYIADHISVKEMDFGTSPPELEILEICELSTDYFRGIFKLTYEGDAFVTLKTKIQANPLYTPPSIIKGSPFLTTYFKTRMVAAHRPLFIPMQLGISNIILNGIITLSISKTKGITLVFKNDPLVKLKVTSTFDIIATIKTYLQKEIEHQLRSFLQDFFPIIVHDFSIRQINDLQNKQTTNRNRDSNDNYVSSFYLNNNNEGDDYNSFVTSSSSSSGYITPTPSLSETSSISSHLNDDGDLLFLPNVYSLTQNTKPSAHIYINHMDNDNITNFDLDHNNEYNNIIIQEEDDSMLVTLSRSNNLLNHMMTLAQQSNSLAYLCNNEKSINHVLHKTFKTMSLSPSSSSSTSTIRIARHNKKIPKRRIWYL